MRISDQFNRWIVWGVVLLAIAGVLYLGYRYSGKPSAIRIATGPKGGYNYKFGEILKTYVEKHTDFRAEVLATKGAEENQAFLLSDKADFAILETGTFTMRNLAAVAPLWDEVVQIVIRKNSPIKCMRDMLRRNVSIGKIGTGNRVNIMKIMDHYGIDPADLNNNDAPLGRMLQDDSMDAAIVTTSPTNPSLALVMESGRFTLLPVEEAEGVAFHHAFFSTTTIPQGVYSTISGPEPQMPVKTVTATAILATREGASPDLIKAVLPILYGIDFRTEVPGLKKKDRATKEPSWTLLSVHPAALSYFNPYTGVERLSGFLEVLFGIVWRSLIAVLILGVILHRLITRRRMLQEEAFAKDRRRLEKWLAEMSRIEQGQKDAKDMRVLKRYLNQALAVKKQAMEEVGIETSIRNSNLFMVFLQESTHVIREIEWKLAVETPEEGIHRRLASGFR